MASTGRSRSYWIASSLLLLALVILAGATTSYLQVPAGKTVTARLNVPQLYIDPSNLTSLDSNVTVTITSYTGGYSSVTIIYSNESGVIHTKMSTLGNNGLSDYGDWASKCKVYIGNGIMYIANLDNKYQHTLDLSNATLSIVWYGGGDGYLAVYTNQTEEENSGGGGIEIPGYSRSMPGLGFLKSVKDFLKSIFVGLEAFISLIGNTVEDIWAIITFVFAYVNIAYGIFHEYVIPYLGLFLGVYFFGTLGAAVASIPRRGFMALVDWGHLWYGHIMALVRFIKLLAEWAWKIIQAVTDLLSKIPIPI